MNQKTKTCPDCEITFPLTKAHFYPRKAYADGSPQFQGRCIKCHNKRNNAHRGKNCEADIERLRDTPYFPDQVPMVGIFWALGAMG